MACKMGLPLLVFLSLLLPFALGGIDVICEELPQELCSFAISSSSKRCVLESTKANDHVEYQCRTSEIEVEKMSNVIESDECVSTCAVDRMWAGISSDSLFETQLTEKLCSTECISNCPNIVDLYYELAAAEGVYLPDLCEARRENPHRAMLQLMSFSATTGSTLAPVSSLVASMAGPSLAPASALAFLMAPAQAPTKN